MIIMDRSTNNIDACGEEGMSDSQKYKLNLYSAAEINKKFVEVKN